MPSRAPEVPSVVDTAEFESLQLERDRRVALASLLLLLAPTLYFFRTDLMVALGNAALLNERFTIRAVFIAAIGVGIWRLRTISNRDDYARTVFGVSMTAALCIVLLNASRPQWSTLPLRTPLMWLLAFYVGLVNRPRLQLLPPLLVSTMLILLRLFWVNSGADNSIDGDIVVIISMNGLGILVVRHRTDLARRELAAWQSERTLRGALERTLADLRLLQGIIPICAYCHNVRTEVGDWQRLDAYVRAHSEAEFSHGICPGCAREHFPEP